VRSSISPESADALPAPEFTIGGSVNAAILSLTKGSRRSGHHRRRPGHAINPGRIKTDRLTKRVTALVTQHGLSTEEAERQMIAKLGSRASASRPKSPICRLPRSPQGGFFQGSLIDLDGGETKSF